MFFLDTNIFVYGLLDSTPLKKQKAIQLIETALGNHQGCVSYQVVQEFANVAVKKFAKRFSPSDAQQFIEAALHPLNRVPSSAALVDKALALQSETAYSFYDCLIIASAQAADCDTLYTEDLQHNQLIGKLRIVNPFLSVAHEARAPTLYGSS
jgi:predicted nucleic acid-binding protein